MKRGNTYFDEKGRELGFSKAFYRLPADSLWEIKDEIRELTGWCSSTFDSKRNGSRRLKDEEKDLLIRYFATKGIDFESGNYTSTKKNSISN